MARQKDLLPKRPGNGRPRIQVDWKKVDELLDAGCSTQNIASHFRISMECLRDNCQMDHGILWSEYSRIGKARGEIPLRQKQYEKAIAGDNQMLIHLGKVRLKQFAYEPKASINDVDLIKALLAHIENKTRDPLSDESGEDDEEDCEPETDPD